MGRPGERNGQSIGKSRSVGHPRGSRRRRADELRLGAVAPSSSSSFLPLGVPRLDLLQHPDPVGLPSGPLWDRVNNRALHDMIVSTHVVRADPAAGGATARRPAASLSSRSQSVSPEVDGRRTSPTAAIPACWPIDGRRTMTDNLHRRPCWGIRRRGRRRSTPEGRHRVPGPTPSRSHPGRPAARAGRQSRGFHPRDGTDPERARSATSQLVRTALRRVFERRDPGPPVVGDRRRRTSEVGAGAGAAEFGPLPMGHEGFVTWDHAVGWSVGRVPHRGPSRLVAIRRRARPSS